MSAPKPRIVEYLSIASVLLFSIAMAIACVLAVRQCEAEVKKEGLKGIAEELWYGENHEEEGGTNDH